MTISRAAAKAKARRVQDYTRDRLLAVFPNLEADDVKCAIMGESGEDLKLSPAARKLVPFSVEAKGRASFAFMKFLEQRAGDKHPPLVIAKADRKRPVAILYADDLIELLRLASLNR